MSKVDELRGAFIDEHGQVRDPAGFILSLASLIEAAKTEERERCAKVVWNWRDYPPSTEAIAEAIRGLK